MKENFIAILILTLFFGSLYYLYNSKLKKLLDTVPSIYYFSSKRKLIKYLKENFNEAFVVSLNFPGLYLIFNLDSFKLKLRFNENNLILITDKYVLFFQKLINKIKIIEKEIEKELIGFDYYSIVDYNYIPNIPVDKFQKILTENKNFFYLFYISDPEKNKPDIELLCNKVEKKCIRIENILMNLDPKIVKKYFINLVYFHYYNNELKEIKSFEKLEYIL